MNKDRLLSEIARMISKVTDCAEVCFGEQTTGIPNSVSVQIDDVMWTVAKVDSGEWNVDFFNVHDMEPDVVAFTAVDEAITYLVGDVFTYCN